MIKSICWKNRILQKALKINHCNNECDFYCFTFYEKKTIIKCLIAFLSIFKYQVPHVNRNVCTFSANFIFA